MNTMTRMEMPMGMDTGMGAGTLGMLRMADATTWSLLKNRTNPKERMGADVRSFLIPALRIET